MSDLMTTPGRSQILRARRRSRRRRRIGTILLIAGLGVGAAFFTTQRAGSDRIATSGAPPALDTTLVAMRLSDDLSGSADALTVFAPRKDGTHPLRMFIPSGALAPIPGQGFEPLARALGKGDPSLLELSVENVLGLRIDDTLVVDDVSLGRMVDEIGGLEVEVPEALTETEAGVSQTVVPAGAQRMDGATALTYMTYRGGDETELTRFVRAQAVIDAFGRADREKVAKAATTIEPAGATLTSDLRAFAKLLSLQGETANLVMPVTPAGGSGAGELYKVEADRTHALLTKEMPGAMFTLEPRMRVDVRNGNGAPGIGERVAALLVPRGFAIELSGNAQNFSEEVTRIVIYDDQQDLRSQAAAIQKLLGVGKIELARRGQSVVDLTIVVGRDFRARA